MILHQTDADGLYLGTVTALPNPRRQGGFLIPRNAYPDAPPAEVPEGRVVRRVDGAWKIQIVPSDDGAGPVEDTIENRREMAFLDRGEFCVRLAPGGMFDPPILSEASAKEAASAIWPADFEPFLVGQPLSVQLKARAKWVDNGTIYYADPLLQDIALAAVSALNPGATALELEILRTGLLDLLFGVEPDV